MEVEYRREMNRNYMVVRPQTTGNETYAVRMLSGNNIRGLLPFQDKNLNGDLKYYYDITSKQPLSRMLEHRNLSGDELKSLISELLYTLKQLERFFLDEGQLCFLPEYIYIEPAGFKASFCLIPGRKTEFAAELCELSQYLLDHVNQSDGEAVVLAFSIFKECRKLNFGIEDIERCLRKQEMQYKERQESAAVPSGQERKKEGIIKPDPIKTIDRSEPEEKPIVLSAEEKKKSCPRIFLIFSILYITLMALVPCVLILWGGFERMRSKWLMLAAGELIAAVVLILILVFLIRRKESDRNRKPQLKKQKKQAERSRQSAWTEYPILKENDEEMENNFEEEPWEVYFRELDEDERGTETWKKDIDESIQEENDEDFQTVLLSARPIEKGSRRLIPVNGGDEIAIGYYPFLIGKGRDLTDYCLNKPGVSRLHVKIEETGDGYWVTDLNSTNGTMVNGNLIDANGTVPLHPGDELTIAAEKYYFR